MAKSRNKFDKLTKTSCIYQLTFNPSYFMQTMQVHKKGFKVHFYYFIFDL